jgi:hypothetical protein
LPGRPRSIFLALILLAACGSADPSGGAQSISTGPGGSPAAGDSLEGTWSTGAVPIDDIRASMLAAGLEADAVDAWIEGQGTPPAITFELRFDGQDFAHSRADEQFPLQVDESGTYMFEDGELRLSFPDLGDAYVFDVTLTDDSLTLELVDQRETGTVEDAATHRLYTVALYGSAPFVRQPRPTNES